MPCVQDFAPSLGDENDGELFGHISLQLPQHLRQPSPPICYQALRIQWDCLLGPWGSQLDAFDLAFRLISISHLRSSQQTPVYIARHSLRRVGSRRTRYQLRLAIQIRTLTSAYGFLPPEVQECLTTSSPHSTLLYLVSSTSSPCGNCMISETRSTSPLCQLELFPPSGASKLPLSCYCHESLALCEYCKLGLNQIVDLFEEI